MKPATVFWYSIVYAFISLSGFYRKILTPDHLSFSYFSDHSVGIRLLCQCFISFRSFSILGLSLGFSRDKHCMPAVPALQREKNRQEFAWLAVTNVM